MEEVNESKITIQFQQGQRKNKGYTYIFGLEKKFKPTEIEDLARKLKTKLGTGGSTKTEDDKMYIMIQGEMTNRIKAYFTTNNLYKQEDIIIRGI